MIDIEVFKLCRCAYCRHARSGMTRQKIRRLSDLDTHTRMLKRESRKQSAGETR